MKIPDERELRNIAINHSKNVIEIYKKYTAEPYSFLVDDKTVSSNNPLRFRKNLYNIIKNDY